MNASPPNPEPRVPRRLVVLLAVAVVLLVAWWFLADSPQRLYERGRARLESDPVAAAELLARSVEAAGGEYPAARLAWARALAGQGLWLEATGCFAEIDDFTTLDDADLLALARESAAAMPTLADYALREIDRDSPLRADVLRLAIPLQRHLLDDDAALAFARELTGLAPDDPLAWETIGDLDRSNVVQSAAAYRRALAAATSPADRGRIARRSLDPHLRIGDAAAARAALEAIGEADRATEEVRFHELRLLRLERRTAEALALADELLDSRDTTAVRYQRGLVRFDAGDWAGAAADLEQVVADDPFQKEAHYKLGMALSRLGRSDDAEPHLARSRALTEAMLELLSYRRTITPNSDRAALERLADLYDRTGNEAEATRWRNEARNRR